MATVAQNNEPDMTPSANVSAGRRPWLAAMDMIARLLGPGLAALTKYAVKATRRWAESAVLTIMANLLPDDRSPVRGEQTGNLTDGESSECRGAPRLAP
ncbi:hypothetical protein MB84_22445 [Pandoraea oxalativorans]|uniref:Uncharacterized protein n=1 Tax=Pandoraea oxalativorans TaxID=573737 RepID=A0A0E3YG87_9BURK|nr:hypothetical protein MB84_22445 [Pandoraea oxalativorans]